MSYLSEVVISIHNDALTSDIRDLLEYWAEKSLYKNNWTLFHLPWVTWDDVIGEGKQVMDHLQTIEDKSQFYYLRLGEGFGDMDDLGEGRFNKAMPFYINYNANLEYGFVEQETNADKLIHTLNAILVEAESGRIEPLLIIRDFMEKINPKLLANS